MALIFDSIGSKYVLSGNYRHCIPCQESWENFATLALRIIALGPGKHRIVKDYFLPIIGLLGPVSQCMIGGSTYHNGDNMLLKAQKGVPESARIFHGDGKFV